MTATAVTAIAGVVVAGALVLRANQPGAGAVVATVLPGSHAMTVLERQRQQMIVMAAAAHTMHLVSAPKIAAVPVPVAALAPAGGPAAGTVGTTGATGVLTPAQVGAYWLGAGGPASAESAAEAVAACESGDNTAAMNPDGAAGLWQILGSVVPGNLLDPAVNAANAVAKFTASGDTWAQWTCQP